jgi:hypothetical protein
MPQVGYKDSSCEVQSQDQVTSHYEQVGSNLGSGGKGSNYDKVTCTSSGFNKTYNLKNRAQSQLLLNSIIAQVGYNHSPGGITAQGTITATRN